MDYLPHAPRQAQYATSLSEQHKASDTMPVLPPHSHTSKEPPLRGRTSAFAAMNYVQAQTVRKRYAATGSYFGIRPKKLANRLLDWPLVAVNRHDDSGEAS